MALAPSRTKFRKSQKGSRAGNAKRGNTLAFGVIGDTHLGSLYEAKDELAAMYEQFKRVGWGLASFTTWTKANARGVAKRTELTIDEADELLLHLGGLPDKEAA
jgi:hypothetical protein